MIAKTKEVYTLSDINILDGLGRVPINTYEKEMLDILIKLKEKFNVVAIKAEFEAEGTRSDEFLRLLEITRRAGLEVALKVGGAEAIRDLIESKQFGVDYIIAPMVETPYALSKYIAAIKTVFTPDEQQDVKFLFNLETHTTFDNFLPMLDHLESEGVNLGVVFGRVDFTLSLGLNRDSINSQKIQQFCLSVAQECKDRQLDLVVGGGVNDESLPLLNELKNIHLSRFETRKVIFDSDFVNNENVTEGLQLAIQFELLWLKNKQDYYTRISQEDNLRIKMLSERVLLSGRK